MPGMPDISLMKSQSLQDPNPATGSANLTHHASSDTVSNEPQIDPQKTKEPAVAAPKAPPKAPTVFKPSFTVPTSGAAPTRSFNRMKKQEAAPVMFKPVSFGNEQDEGAAPAYVPKPVVEEEEKPPEAEIFHDAVSNDPAMYAPPPKAPTHFSSEDFDRKQRMDNPADKMRLQ